MTPPSFLAAAITPSHSAELTVPPDVPAGAALPAAVVDAPAPVVVAAAPAADVVAAAPAAVVVAAAAVVDELFESLPQPAIIVATPMAASAAMAAPRTRSGHDPPFGHPLAQFIMRMNSS